MSDKIEHSYQRDQVISIINSVISKVGTAPSDVSSEEIFNELKSLKAVIDQARSEVGGIKAHDINDKHIPTATDELDAIVNATAEATGNIMDACEAIQEIAATGDVADSIESHVTNIFEACSFQDITGQRITKIVNTLKSIEEKVNRLVDVLGHHDKEISKSDEGDERTGDNALLNGPQLPEDAISQEEIDKLLADFD